MNTERVHWRDLPTKHLTTGLFGFRVVLVGDLWDAASGVLNVDGVRDISETDEVKVFLASPVAQLEPPILRVFEPDWAEKPDGLLALTERDGEMVLGLIVRSDLTSPATPHGPGSD